MIDIWIVLYIILIHNIADFWCQTKEQAMNKSHNFTKLLDHTIHYSYLMLELRSIIISNSMDGVPGFWFIISVDQILHYLQLLLMYYVLTL